ncbi:MAG TPA: 50S ribosomal protein L11 methyltransferase, partial [Alphaproteobacteria bacterium]|nr:50S ribosomal protein L11 methyltransferase [Alphaproteobacteria bacterium]
TGALAIAAAKVLPNASILASDIDPDSTAETARNCQKNGVPQIEAITAEGFDHVMLVGAKFDLIFANILAEPLVILAAEIVAGLNPGGIAILSGLLVEQEAQVRAAYEEKGVTVEAREPIEGWATLVVRKD